MTEQQPLRASTSTVATTVASAELGKKKKKKEKAIVTLDTYDNQESNVHNQLPCPTPQLQ